MKQVNRPTVHIDDDDGDNDDDHYEDNDERSCGKK